MKHITTQKSYVYIWVLDWWGTPTKKAGCGGLLFFPQRRKMTCERRSGSSELNVWSMWKLTSQKNRRRQKLEKKPFPRPVDLVVLPFEKKRVPVFLPTYFNLRQNSAKFKTTCLCSLKSSETCIFLQRTHQDLWKNSKISEIFWNFL